MKDRRLFRPFIAALATALIALPLIAPGHAADDVSEVRSASGFDRIRLDGAFTAEIRAGAARTRVVISADRDTMPHITTTVNDGTLVVGMHDATFSHRVPKLVIALPVLRSFTNAGAGKVAIIGLTGNDVRLENAGAASIVAAGRAGRLAIALNGAGNIDTTAVDARDVDVENNGLGNVDVRAGESLMMNVNGIGEIRYAGNPAHIESHVNGIGRIKRM